MLPDVRCGTLLLNSFWRIKRTPTWSPIIPNSVYKVMHRVAILFTPPSHRTTSYSSKPSVLDVLWNQLIKLVQVASTSELRKNQRNDLLSFEIVFCHFYGVSEFTNVLLYCFTSKQVRGIFLIIETKIIFVVNTFLRI